MSLIIREVNIEDAKSLIDLNNKLDEETEFRAYQPGERDESIDSFKVELNKIIRSSNSTIFVAQVKGEIVGILEAIGGKYNRNKHSVHIVVAVLKKYWGMGIGIRLLEECRNWAFANNIHRIDLTVFTYNSAAIKLYEKVGFIKEGIKKDSFLVDGKYVDEYIMALLL